VYAGDREVNITTDSTREPLKGEAGKVTDRFGDDILISCRSSRLTAKIDFPVTG
jgi:hypothetical protein